MDFLETREIREENTENHAISLNDIQRGHLILSLLFDYLTDNATRVALSEVSRDMYEQEVLSRKKIEVATYAVSMDRIRRKNYLKLEFLELKGKPKLSSRLILDYGDEEACHAYSWGCGIDNYFNELKYVTFQGMWVNDDDIGVISRAISGTLEGLKVLDCKGNLTTRSLCNVARNCRKLRLLSVAKSTAFVDVPGYNWIRELANRKVLDTLDFYGTWLVVNPKDLEYLAMLCPLSSLRVNRIKIDKLVRFFQVATKLSVFGGGSFAESHDPEVDPDVLPLDQFPFEGTRLTSVGIFHINSDRDDDLDQLLLLDAAKITELDIRASFITGHDHAVILSGFLNLEVLKVSNNIGNVGLNTVSLCCPKLRKLCIKESGNQSHMVTSEGIRVVVSRCNNLECLRIDVIEISDEDLIAIGRHCPKLIEFKLEIIGKNPSCEAESPKDEISLVLTPIGIQNEFLDQGMEHGLLDQGIFHLTQSCPIKKMSLLIQRRFLSRFGIRTVATQSMSLRHLILLNIDEESLFFLFRNNGIEILEILEASGRVSESFLSKSISTIGNSYRYLWLCGYEVSLGPIPNPQHPPHWRVSFKPPCRRTGRASEFSAYTTLRHGCISTPSLL